MHIEHDGQPHWPIPEPARTHQFVESMFGRRNACTQAELGFDARTRCFAHLMGELGIGQDPYQSIGERIGIVGRYQVARRWFLDHLGHAADRGADRRPARRHCLEQRHRKAFHGVGTQDEHVYGPEEVRNIRARPRQHDAVGEIEFADEAFDPGPHRAVTDHQELRCRYTVDHQACGLKKVLVVLLRPQPREYPDDLVGFADTEIGHRATFIGPLETIGIDPVVDDVDLVRRVLQVVDQIIVLRPRHPEIGAGHPVQHAVCNSAHRAPRLYVAVVVNPDNIVRHVCQPSRDTAEHLGVVAARYHNIRARNHASHAPGRTTARIACHLVRCSATTREPDRARSSKSDPSLPMHTTAVSKRERSRFGISVVTCRSAPPTPRRGTTYITRMRFGRVTGRPRAEAGRSCARRRGPGSRLVVASTNCQA